MRVYFCALCFLMACSSTHGDDSVDSAVGSTSTLTTSSGTTASGSPAGPSTGATSTASGTPSTGTSSGTVTTPTNRNGTYSGTLHVDIEDIGFVVNYDSCDAPLTLTIDEAATPQITGSTTCYPTGILSSQSLYLDFQGYLGPTEDAAGVVDMQWNSTFAPDDNWSAVFLDTVTLEGAFSGQELQGSAGFGWDATFTVAR